jgi:hypothetical protein
LHRTRAPLLTWDAFDLLVPWGARVAARSLVRRGPRLPRPVRRGCLVGYLLQLYAREHAGDIAGVYTRGGELRRGQRR